jgi:phosphoglucosamine mutase
MKQLQSNLFGTDGIRATFGTAPLTIQELQRLGMALALWAQEKYEIYPQIAIGYDTRISCSLVKAALQSGLLLYPVTLHDAGIVPTPTLSYLLQHTNTVHCGIMISASHNPYQDNGLKIIDARHGKLSLSDELRISELYAAQTLENVTYTTPGSGQAWNNAQDAYINHLQTLLPKNFLEGIKLVLDCAHGATFRLAPALFKHFGAQVITLNNQPNGININHQCGALHVQDVQQTVIDTKAHMGFAFDGDGDRVIAVNSQGYLKDGDDILALLLEHPMYASTPAVVGTVMTNQGLEKLLKDKNKQLLRTAVGDKHVAHRMHQDNLILGGEQSGHTILRDHITTGDGIFTALRVAQSVLANHNWTMKTFDHYPQVMFTFPVTIKKELASPAIAILIEHSKAQLQAGRILVRYSGTENVVRIMIEDREHAHAQHVGALLAQALQKELSN